MRYIGDKGFVNMYAIFTGKLKKKNSENTKIFLEVKRISIDLFCQAVAQKWTIVNTPNI